MTRTARNLKLVQPVLVQLEAAVVEAASQQYPIPTRYSTQRGRVAARLREIANETQEWVDRRTLAQKLRDNDIEACDAQISDLTDESNLLLRGIQPADVPTERLGNG